MVVATKMFWALGYNQVEYFLTTLRPETIDDRPDGDGAAPVGRAHADDAGRSCGEPRTRPPQGRTDRIASAAGRLLPGKVLGGFQYQGTRPDDPNDIVPHEHRRELRALRVFGAWTNLTDMKAGNTLDTLVTEGGRGVVRHYLQDVGSTFGVGANGPHDWNEGWEHVYDGAATQRRLLTFGFALQPVADGRLRRIPGHRPLRRRGVRSRDVEAARADGGLLRDARRRRVLGGAARDGVLRRR